MASADSAALLEKLTVELKFIMIETEERRITLSRQGRQSVTGGLSHRTETDFSNLTTFFVRALKCFVSYSFFTSMDCTHLFKYYIFGFVINCSLT